MFRVYGGQPVGMGNAGAIAGKVPSAPGSSPYSEFPKEYLQQRNPFGGPPVPQAPQQAPQPGVPVQLELPLAMGSSNLPNALPGAPGNMFGMMMAQLPGGEQGPAQGPNTPVKFYRGLGYAPYGPGGGGLPPTPVRGA